MSDLFEKSKLAMLAEYLACPTCHGHGKIKETMDDRPNGANGFNWIPGVIACPDCDEGEEG